MRKNCSNVGLNWGLSINSFFHVNVCVLDLCTEKNQNNNTTVAVNPPTSRSWFLSTNLYYKVFRFLEELVDCMSIARKGEDEPGPFYTHKAKKHSNISGGLLKRV